MLNIRLITGQVQDGQGLEWRTVWEALLPAHSRSPTPGRLGLVGERSAYVHRLDQGTQLVPLTCVCSGRDTKTALAEPDPHFALEKDLKKTHISKGSCLLAAHLNLPGIEDISSVLPPGKPSNCRSTFLAAYIVE